MSNCRSNGSQDEIKRLHTVGVGLRLRPVKSSAAAKSLAVDERQDVIRGSVVAERKKASDIAARHLTDAGFIAVKSKPKFPRWADRHRLVGAKQGSPQMVDQRGRCIHHPQTWPPTYRDRLAAARSGIGQQNGPAATCDHPESAQTGLTGRQGVAGRRARSALRRDRDVRSVRRGALGSLRCLFGQDSHASGSGPTMIWPRWPVAGLIPVTKRLSATLLA